ncbi:hypothetical protein TraAM80_06179 [Trypanosoma rangeli]|uniref:DUF3456 domain-containing protein n=1 Tax=Trypanosoma rangeli TaxID=5698 RepID=A0A422NB75_TRYRA|nr:uncharacterized protein TraAM80_06179 [Trypanosoma rangeli]RNF02728.1 hypothetical protein TraAM80_06179 [Trypanosoma rangeli]|eukprot:RNF02728.1 hypothetical protein TraAM80_06179 [Trypanosoma rangeli]
MLSASAATLGDPRFRIHGPSYAYMDCSACIAFAGYLGQRMNASLEYDGRGGATFLSTHRLNEENKLQRSVYATSELRSVEVLEKICNDALRENYVLRLDLDRRIRVYESEKSDSPFAQHYSMQDADALKSPSKTAVWTFCTRVMSEEEDAMMALVREVHDLTELERRLCGGNDVNSSAVTTPPPPLENLVTAVCIGTEASLNAELGRIQRYELWQDSISKRREEALKNIREESDEPVFAKPVEPDDERYKPWSLFPEMDAATGEDGDIDDSDDTAERNMDL